MVVWERMYGNRDMGGEPGSLLAVACGAPPPRGGK